MSRPIIGITANLLYRTVGNSDGKYITYNNQDYEQCIFKTGGIPLILSVTDKIDLIQAQVDCCDGILLAGGDDINPILYGEEPSKNLGETNLLVDSNHLSVAKYALSKRIPILGICRGMQVLNIASGGNVFQDLSEYHTTHLNHSQNAPRTDYCHTVTTEDNSILRKTLGTSFFVNSFHHQAVHKLGENIIATAYSKDRLIEAIEHQDYPFFLGVQWHPEILAVHNNSMSTLFNAFIMACIKS
ncbi:MAG: gamma-glutamyl-gamma-aminobutyrate hydrolase family protein [Cellulosilyticaceae bacterium]